MSRQGEGRVRIELSLGVLDSSLDEAVYDGMYPPLHDRNIAPSEFYPTYIQTYVERDVRLVRNVGDLATFARFVQLCAGRIGSTLNCRHSAMSSRSITRRCAHGYRFLRRAS